MVSPVAIGSSSDACWQHPLTHPSIGRFSSWASSQICSARQMARALHFCISSTHSQFLPVPVHNLFFFFSNCGSNDGAWQDRATFVRFRASERSFFALLTHGARPTWQGVPRKDSYPFNPFIYCKSLALLDSCCAEHPYCFERPDSASLSPLWFYWQSL